MADLEAVLFDMGDTLVDLGEGRGDYEARLLSRAGRVYDVLVAAGVSLRERPAFAEALATDSEAQYHAALAERKGMDIYTVLRRFFAARAIPTHDGLLEAASEAYCLGGGAISAPLRAGALETLAALRDRGLRLGAISNTVQPDHFMRQTMVRRGLAEYFDVQVYSSEAGIAKPDPAIFRLALRALNLPPGNAVYVGDRLAIDVAGAQAAGMKGVLLEVAHRAEHDPAIVPDARIKELPELLDVLPRLYPRGDLEGSNA